MIQCKKIQSRRLLDEFRTFSPYTIKDVTLKPDCYVTYVHVFIGKRGWPSNEFPSHSLWNKSAGQVGLVMIEATAVLPEGRISNKDLGIWDNSLIEGLHKTTTFIHDNGAKAPFNSLTPEEKQN